MDKLVSNLPRGLSIPTANPTPAPITSTSPPTFDNAIGNAILETISGLKAARWFTVPIDLTMQNYTKRISSPIDLPTIQDKLQKRKYTTPDQFALDVRRTFANCLVYNFEIGASNIRNDAKTCLLKFEQEWRKANLDNATPVHVYFILSDCHRQWVTSRSA